MVYNINKFMFMGKCCSWSADISFNFHCFNAMFFRLKLFMLKSKNLLLTWAKTAIKFSKKHKTLIGRMAYSWELSQYFSFVWMYILNYLCPNLVGLKEWHHPKNPGIIFISSSLTMCHKYPFCVLLISSV